jgi:hypothetical protein
MWRLTWTSSYLYPRVVMNWIDVHPAGENLINTTRTLPTLVHVCPAYTSYGQSSYVATFHKSSTALNVSHCSWEKGLPTQSTSHRLTGPHVRTQFFSQANQWSSSLKPSFCWWQAIRFTGLISPVCDQYVQYFLTGANPSVLNRHRLGLQPYRCRFATPLPDLPNRRSYTFHLMTPPDLRLSIQTISTEIKREQTLNLMSEISPLDFYHSLSSKHSMN